jgi:predicted kinase
VTGQPGRAGLPVLIVVTGHPGAGKTTLGRRLSADLSLPFVGRDDLKEILFDTLGWSDREWSRKLGRASYELLYHVVRVLLGAGCSCIAESNFDREHSSARLRSLVPLEKYRCCQLVCVADPDVLLRRVMDRARRGDRHPGHVEESAVAELRQRLQTHPARPLDLPGPVILVHTTEPAATDYHGLLQQLRALLREEISA